MLSSPGPIVGREHVRNGRSVMERSLRDEGADMFSSDGDAEPVRVRTLRDEGRDAAYRRWLNNGRQPARCRPESPSSLRRVSARLLIKLCGPSVRVARNGNVFI